MAHRNEHLIR